MQARQGSWSSQRQPSTAQEGNHQALVTCSSPGCMSLQGFWNTVLISKTDLPLGKLSVASHGLWQEGRWVMPRGLPRGGPALRRIKAGTQGRQLSVCGVQPWPLC